MTMNPNNYKIALAFPLEEMKNHILDLLATREISTQHDASSTHYIGDERQDEFVDVHLRLAAWRVCAALSGWEATTEFDAADTITINLSLGTPADAARSTMLAEAVRDWICSTVAHLALQIMTGADKPESSMKDAGETAKQRVLMMLCASDMLRKVS